MREIIEVNGIKYDAITGQKIEILNKQAAYSAQNIHDNLQHSSTLSRKFVKRPNDIGLSQAHAIEQFKMRHNYIEARKSAILRSGNESHTQISKFEGVRGSAGRMVSPISLQDKIISKAVNEDPILPIQENPALEAMRKQKIAKRLQTPQEIKKSAISTALENSQDNAKNIKKIRGAQKKSWFSKRVVGFVASCSFLMILFGYFVYINSPNLSIRVAAIQSGVNAGLPQYSAKGYSLKGLAYFDGNSVNLKYINGEKFYKIKQAQTSWDSVALLENYVQDKWDRDYSTYQEKGLTIYKNRNNEATWVNNGVLYNIETNSNLSNEDIRKIASSF